VTTSQHPLLPPQPEPTPVPESKETETESALVEEKEEPVTDVVDEQVGSGEVEPVPTPAVGGEAEHPVEEVTEEGGVEQVDEELKELKVEGGGAVAAESTEAPVAEEAQASEVEPKGAEISTPQVTEETTEVEPETVAPAAESRKQERVENPTFTLETVGNKYNTGNFW
jgi:capping protein alpha